MKDYKRLTNNNLEEYDPEYDFCVGCKYFGEPNGCNRPNGTCDDYERFNETYNRLAELEDKIESGELCEQGYRKLPENSVVLSKEELAQKIYDDIFVILKIKLWLYGDDAMTKSLNGLTKQKILDFTKKWGIKDNHLNEKDYSHIDHLQVHDKQIKEQTSKETAEKILKPLYNVIMEHPDCCVNLSEDIKFLMEKYGIDLENEE